jgi:molybdopterin-guanine dinucleotide biosynthesis protein A
MVAMTSDRSMVAVILAGGQGRRFGGTDKSFVTLAGKPLVQHVIERITPQIPEVVINTSGTPDRFQLLGLTVVTDQPRETAATGPLVGLTSAFMALRQAGNLTSAVLSVPVDTPFLPSDLVARLADALGRGAAVVAYAASAIRDHPIIALWTPESRETACGVFRQQPEISLHGMMERMASVRVVFDDDSPADPFFNINTPDDLDRAERLMSGRADGPAR